MLRVFNYIVMCFVIVIPTSAHGQTNTYDKQDPEEIDWCQLALESCEFWSSLCHQAQQDYFDCIDGYPFRPFWCADEYRWARNYCTAAAGCWKQFEDQYGEDCDDDVA